MAKTDLRACPDFLAVFSEFIDGSLDPDDSSEILAHLDCCEGCLRHLRAYRRGVSTFRSMEVESYEAGTQNFYAELEERLRRGATWGYLEPAPCGTYCKPQRWSARLPAVGLTVAAVIAFVVLFSGGEGEGLRYDMDQTPVSFASVIPTVWGGGSVAGTEPDATRAEVARRAVSGVQRPTVPDPVEETPDLRTESLENEFERALILIRLQEAAWGSTPGGGWVAPKWVTAREPAALLFEAALSLP